jgi:hypothetical protein
MQEAQAQPTTSALGPAGVWATAARLLTFVLAGLAVALDGSASGVRLAYLGVGYLALAALFWVLERRSGRSWPAYAAALVDVGALTAYLALFPATPLPLWTLYFFPLASAGLAGRGPLAVPAALGLAGYLGASWLATGAISAVALWPAALLVAITPSMAALATLGLAERRERLAWQEAVAAARALRVEGEPDEVASAVAEAARRLVGGRRAWIWWGDAAGEPQTGKVLDSLPSIGPLRP